MADTPPEPPPITVVLPDDQEFSWGAAVARGHPLGLHAAQRRFRRC